MCKSHTIAFSRRDREPAWHRRKRKARSVARKFLKSFAANPTLRKAGRAVRLVDLLEKHHSLPFYTSVRTALHRIGMSSWNRGWKGGYWAGAARSPKKKSGKNQQNGKGADSGKDVALPGYDSERWLSSSGSRPSSSTTPSQPTVMELTKVLQTIVQAGNIELPEEAKHLLKNQAATEVKDNIQKEQRLINIRRKAHSKLVRLQAALESKKEKFLAYKAALREQLAKESERYEKDVQSLHKAIKEAQEHLEKIEAEELEKEEETEEPDLDMMLDTSDSTEKAHLHAQLANTEKEKQEAVEKAAALQSQMEAMQMQYRSLAQSLHAPLGSQRHPLNVSPVPSEELKAMSPQMPLGGNTRHQVGPFSRSNTPRARPGPYADSKTPCGVEAKESCRSGQDGLIGGLIFTPPDGQWLGPAALIFSYLGFAADFGTQENSMPFDRCSGSPENFVGIQHCGCDDSFLYFIFHHAAKESGCTEKAIVR